MHILVVVVIMKSFLLCVLALASAATAYQVPLRYYHESVGIAEAARIRQYEQALDFDGRIAGGQSVNAGAQPHFVNIFLVLPNHITPEVNFLTHFCSQVSHSLEG